MNFEDDAMSEVAAAILSIDGPYIDLSNPERLMEQTSPIEEYYNLPEEKFPMAIIYIDGEAYNLVANDRFEISLYFNIVLVYKYNKGETKTAALERGKKCLRQIQRKILDRQRMGDANVAFYPSTSMENISAVNHDTNPDGNDLICVVSGNITFHQPDNEEDEYA